MAADWQVSSIRLAGLASELKHQGLLQRVLVHCQPETRAAVDVPHLRRSHSGHLLIDLNDAIVRETGTGGLERLNYAAMKAAYSGIARSLVAITMTLTGRSPGTLFARLPDTSKRVLIGVDTTWSSAGGSSGVVAVEYPDDVPAHTEFAWRGSLKFVSELAGSTVRIERVEASPRRFEFHLAW